MGTIYRGSEPGVGNFQVHADYWDFGIFMEIGNKRIERWVSRYRASGNPNDLTKVQAILREHGFTIGEEHGSHDLTTQDR